MYGFSILMLIFGVCVFLVGLYMFTGHKLGIMTIRPAFKNLTIDQWKNVGKWTMITSSLMFILAILGYIFEWS